MTLLRIFLTFGVVAIVCFSTAQTVHLPGSTLDKPPVIDGIIDEAAEWKGAATADALLDTVTGQQPPEASKFWLASDKDFIYFAGRLSDSHPGSIQAHEYRTNVSLLGDDFAQLTLDLSGSLADFNAFSINPKGATDIRLAGGRAAKREWSGEFLAKARITDQGWEFEARIPWQIMRLPASGLRNIRFIINRQIQRTQRIYTTAYIANQSLQNAGFWERVSVPKEKVDHSILLLPYTYLGTGQKEGFISNSGIDLKTQLTEEIPAVASINPDFRNIENQILSLDFSRFARLAGETRPFFQEGQQYFNSALFASQKILDFDAGLNIHGKASDKISFGVLDTLGAQRTNDLVTNLSYDPTPVDSFRFTGTSVHEPGANNDAYLLRYQRLFGNYGLFLRTMGTKDSVVGNGIWNTGLLFFNQGAWNAGIEYDAVSPDFFPEIGFAPETDYKGFSATAGIQKPVKWGAITEAGFQFQGLSYDRFQGGFYRNQLNPSANVVLHDGTLITITPDFEDFLGSHDHIYDFNILRPRNHPYNNISIDYQFGEVTQTNYTSLRLGSAFKPNKNLQVLGSYQVVQLGDRTDQAIVGMNYDLGNNQALAGRVVKQGHDWNAYLAFQRSGNRGTEYYLILGDPNAPRFQRSLILKVVMPLKIG